MVSNANKSQSYDGANVYSIIDFRLIRFEPNHQHIKAKSPSSKLLKVDKLRVTIHVTSELHVIKILSAFIGKRSK
jgi:hypothetical protein